MGVEPPAALVARMNRRIMAVLDAAREFEADPGMHTWDRFDAATDDMLAEHPTILGAAIMAMATTIARDGFRMGDPSLN